ncbi:MAG TPA: hypothetical protein EYQ84_05655 [Nitrospinaceae bacterium]|nr:hypothetical protein [Nitrospinaceae bacterium]
MKINQYIQQYRSVASCQTPHVRCRDGFTMSVQAGGDGIYSIPRGMAGHYESVEVGRVDAHVPEFKGYEDGSVFPFVPCSVVDKVIENHGGIVLSRRLYS